MSSKKERKSKNPKAQQIIDIVVTSIEALVVVVCIVVSVMVWVGASDPADRSLNWFAIQTDSMMGNNPDSLNPGDLMFAKKVKSITDLQVGDVVAFKSSIRDSLGNIIEDQIVTHRIIAIDYQNNSIVTRGDNAEGSDSSKQFSAIIGKYTGKIPGLGKVNLWLGGYKKVVTNEARYADPNQLGGYGYEQSGKTTAFLVIIIPLALLFIYNGYVVVKWVMDERAKKIREEALEEVQAGSNTAENEEAIKRAALVEFMRSQGMTDEQIDAYFAAQSTKDVPADTGDTSVDTTDKPE